MRGKIKLSTECYNQGPCDFITVMFGTQYFGIEDTED